MSVIVIACIIIQYRGYDSVTPVASCESSFFSLFRSDSPASRERLSSASPGDTEQEVSKDKIAIRAIKFVFKGVKRKHPEKGVQASCPFPVKFEQRLRRASLWPSSKQALVASQ
jgi:hypothetical protein